MKFFATIVICAVFAAAALAVPAPEPSPEPSPIPEPAMKRDIEQLGLQQYDPAFVHGNSDLLRLKKSYGGHSAPSYAAPSYGPSKMTYHAPAPTIPCSKAIVVSCAPSVIPAPCSAPPSHGY